MDTELYLPPRWVPDPTLKTLLPLQIDYREFSRIPESPRYLVSVCGAGVWDIYDGRFLKPMCGEKDPRRQRFRLNLGPNSLPIRVAYARIVCTLIYGPCPFVNGVAHHEDENPADNFWPNLKWQTEAQNRAMAREQSRRRKAVRRKAGREAKKRPGERNGRTKLTSAQLYEFITDHDEMKGDPSPHWWECSAELYSVSTRHLRRIVDGHSRIEDVAKVRRFRSNQNQRRDELHKKLSEYFFNQLN